MASTAPEAVAPHILLAHPNVGIFLRLWPLRAALRLLHLRFHRLQALLALDLALDTVSFRQQIVVALLLFLVEVAPLFFNIVEQRAWVIFAARSCCHCKILFFTLFSPLI